MDCLLQGTWRSTCGRTRGRSRTAARCATPPGRTRAISSVTCSNTTFTSAGKRRGSTFGRGSKSLIRGPRTWQGPFFLFIKISNRVFQCRSWIFPDSSPCSSFVLSLRCDSAWHISVPFDTFHEYHSVRRDFLSLHRFDNFLSRQFMRRGLPELGDSVGGDWAPERLAPLRLPLLSRRRLHQVPQGQTGRLTLTCRVGLLTVKPVSKVVLHSVIPNLIGNKVSNFGE